jgi:transposase
MINEIIHYFKEIFNNKVLTKQEQINILEKSIGNKNEITEEDNIDNADTDCKITLTEEQTKKLEKLAKGRCTAQHLKQRASIILELVKTENTSKTAEALNVSRPTVYLWKYRWLKGQKELERIEREEPWKLRRTINSLLSDGYRSGRKSKFSMIEIAHIVYLSLQTPESQGVPVSHWTPGALAEKAKELEIVEKISARQVGRYLNQMDIKIHQYKGWLNSGDKIKDPEEFEKRVQKVCQVYQNSNQLAEEGIHILSTDEKTGIQALEHKHPAKPVKIGEVEKCEQEYIRHGTAALIASRDIVTGKITTPLIHETRTEEDFEDFVKHISEVTALFPKDRYIFIMDQLNTHMSEGLVRHIARQCGIEEETLGEKGKYGILKTMKSRQEFLENKDNRIFIVYTPKHCSWMNQIEIWFSILSRMLLNKRSSFKALGVLKQKILDFINYYNEHLAKPFKWSYSGKLLKA